MSHVRCQKKKMEKVVELVGSSAVPCSRNSGVLPNSEFFRK
jgi:hypothetical protein